MGKKRVTPVECPVPQWVADFEKLHLTRFVDSSGTVSYYDENMKLHRDFDLPAVMKVDGNLQWFNHGIQHRSNDQPAAVREDGTLEWWVNGWRHRDNDLPATVRPDGTREWWFEGERSRDNDLPAIIRPGGNEEWFVDGLRHRDNDRPALLYYNDPDGPVSKVWYCNGLIHRDGGKPAKILQGTHKEWWINNVFQYDITLHETVGEYFS